MPSEDGAGAVCQAVIHASNDDDDDDDMGREEEEEGADGCQDMSLPKRLGQSDGRTQSLADQIVSSTNHGDGK